MLKTRVTELLGIDTPIFQGGMAWVSNASLASAVSEAGGLGIIAAGSASLDWIEEQIVQARKTTKKPIGVNVMMTRANVPEIAQLLADLRVEVITTGAGSPSSYIDMWKAAGCTVIPVIASSAHATRMEKCGADAVIAEGCEAGGHIGELTTMALTPQVCDSVKIPVIAAGGIADGRGLAAAFSLGAEGVQLGTRFLTVEECTIADSYKDKVLGAKDSDTIVTGRASGHPVRGLKNSFSRTARKIEEGSLGDDAKLEDHLMGALRKAVQGDASEGWLLAGQIACLVKSKNKASEVMAEIIESAQVITGGRLEEISACNAARTMNA